MHAALVRALLEELERVVPSANEVGECELGRQLAEELAGLGCRLLECAARMTSAAEGSEGAARSTRYSSALRIRLATPSLAPVQGNSLGGHEETHP
jgi:hypothetical protein